MESVRAPHVRPLLVTVKGLPPSRAGAYNRWGTQEAGVVMGRDGAHATAGEAIVFWSWIGVLVGGLAAMIAIAVSGR